MVYCAEYFKGGGALFTKKSSENEYSCGQAILKSREICSTSERWSIEWHRVCHAAGRRRKKTNNKTKVVDIEWMSSCSVSMRKKLLTEWRKVFQSHNSRFNSENTRQTKVTDWMMEWMMLYFNESEWYRVFQSRRQRGRSSRHDLLKVQSFSFQWEGNYSLNECWKV